MCSSDLAMGVAWQPGTDGGIAHSAVIVMVDSTGHVAEQRLGLADDPAGLLTAWRAISR